MDTSLFDFELPPSRIAQRPLEPRDASKLLVCRARGRLSARPKDSDAGLSCASAANDSAAGRLGEWGSGFGMSDHVFRDLAEMLGPDDWLVVNDAKVLPVRILGRTEEGGGAVEALLLKHQGGLEWSALLHLSARVRPGLKLVFEPGVVAEVLSTHEERLASDGEARLRFGGLTLGERLDIRLPTGDRSPKSGESNTVFESESESSDSGPRSAACGLEFSRFLAWLSRHGHVPLPPYIHRADGAEDKARYQTVYARAAGSAAAPTAGFHFTPELLARLEERGVKRSAVTLHVGLGTFRPIKSGNIESHEMHEEEFEIPEAFVEEFARRRAGGAGRRRLVAVGTTVVRALEGWAERCAERGIEPGAPGSAGRFRTRLFLKPGARFRAVDDLITNFHLPRSTLLVLVSAAMGLKPAQDAYRRALERGYRFFSYGDAMFIRGMP